MEDRILLAHGSGGKLSQDLIEKIFVPVLDNPILNKLDDSAVFELGGRLAFTTDSYVVSPIFFPGGDIGKLAVCGTVNDLSMSGALPSYLSLSLIIEEGLLITDLEKIVNSAHQAAVEAGADALVAVNTVRAMAIDVETARPILANRIGGLSGPAIKPIAVRCVYEIYGEVDVPIVGCGGVTSWRDAVEFMLAGASAVQVGSGIYY